VLVRWLPADGSDTAARLSLLSATLLWVPLVLSSSSGLVAQTEDAKALPCIWRTYGIHRHATPQVESGRPRTKKTQKPIFRPGRSGSSAYPDGYELSNLGVDP
jgi:hypothetical protein